VIGAVNDAKPICLTNCSYYSSRRHGCQIGQRRRLQGIRWRNSVL